MKEEPMLPARLIKVKDAANYLAISERTLWNLEKDGKIPAIRFGKTLRFSVEDLDAFIQSCKSGTAPVQTEKPKALSAGPAINRSYPNHCVNCMYWFEKARQEATDKIGYCKRFPPTFVTFTGDEQKMNYFYTGHENWCGEFKSMCE